MIIMRHPSFGFCEGGWSDYHRRWWLHVGYWLILI